jgi:hypothetical protein
MRFIINCWLEDLDLVKKGFVLLSEFASIAGEGVSQLFSNSNKLF